MNRYTQHIQKQIERHAMMGHRYIRFVEDEAELRAHTNQLRANNQWLQSIIHREESEEHS